MEKKIEFRSKHFNELNISELYEIDKANKLIEEVQDIMFKNAMVEKNQMGVDEALSKINNIYKNFIYKEDINMKNIKYSYRLESNILLAKSILKAIDLRKESRGSHYRSDYPTINEKMDRRINVEFDNDIKVYFQGEWQNACSRYAIRKT